ncbi:hypothetical protein FB45DRAFT_157548 [Roridomyces roridus]|uniref:Uncharacterized protein n=1 Tax=Roridomyces roridus TaxID=1738132 RepID=A0AAD7BFE0_9AGAR|nr:hypothetical protein FB45DRAFT_157548 [Roridomyces roridus]
MSAPETPAIEYSRYLRMDIPHRIQSGGSTFNLTHETTAETRRLYDSLITTLTRRDFVTPLCGSIDAAIAGNVIIPEDEYNPDLQNEQCVAESVLANVLEQVRKALETCYPELFTTLANIPRGKYRVSIRCQQSPVNDSTRCDHHFILEYDHPESETPRVPPYHHVEEFLNAIYRRVRWNQENPAGNTAEAPPYPALALVILEEKVRRPWFSFIHKGSHRVGCIEAHDGRSVCISLGLFKRGQGRRKKCPTVCSASGAVCLLKLYFRFHPSSSYSYSVAAKCNLVILTDYLHTVLLDLHVTASAIDAIICEHADHTVVREDALAARYKIFAAVLLRLHAAGLLDEEFSPVVVAVDRA